MSEFDKDPNIIAMRLHELYRELKYVKLDTLGLHNLNPLREEIKERLKVFGIDV